MPNELKDIARINVHDVPNLYLNCWFRHLHLCVCTHHHLTCVLCKQFILKTLLVIYSIIIE
jgi:hypothetical protein